jgi:hypothetical protein
MRESVKNVGWNDNCGDVGGNNIIKQTNKQTDEGQLRAAL